MRSVAKGTMHDLVKITRKYRATGDTDILCAKHDKAFKLSKQAFGDDLNWLGFSDVVTGVLSLNGSATNDTIYKIFQLIGIEVGEEKSDG